MNQLHDEVKEFEALNDINHVWVEADQGGHPAELFQGFLVAVVHLHLLVDLSEVALGGQLLSPFILMYHVAHDLKGLKSDLFIMCAQHEAEHFIEKQPINQIPTFLDPVTSTLRHILDNKRSILFERTLEERFQLHLYGFLRLTQIILLFLHFNKPFESIVVILKVNRFVVVHCVI